MERPMEPVMPGIFQDEEHHDLIDHGGPCGEWNICRHAEVSAHWVEKPSAMIRPLIKTH